MNWDSELVRRAYRVVDETAIEVVDSDDYGRRVVIVTDCSDEKQKAFYVSENMQPFEVSSTFCTDEKRKFVAGIVQDNWKSILGKLYEEHDTWEGRT